jgi:Flagellar hook-length control protein FliK
MEPIVSVAVAALRAQLPDFTLRAGSTVMARVAAKHEQHAVIVLAGMPLTAKVPDEVEAGATLKLKVKDVTPERVTLQIEPQALEGQPPPPAAPPQPKVTVEEAPQRTRGADGEPVDVVTLAFHSPTLGRIDLRLELRGERLDTEVTASAGPPLEAARTDSERLRANLRTAGLDPTVTVRPRRESFDGYA